MKDKIISVLALFSSTGTLICCVLPAVVATIAGGAAVSAMLTTFPWLIPLSQYKGWIFLVAGILIAFNGILVLKPKGTVACAVTGGKGCDITDRFNRIMFWSAVVIYGIGAFFSYALVPVLRWIN